MAPARRIEQTSATNPGVGIMLLDNQLPRPYGDVGNASTFPYPIAYDVIPGAETTRVVERMADGLLDSALETGVRLVTQGVRAITTCCGFLAIYQRELAAELPVPVATSSLLQVPLALQTLQADQCVAVLTVNASTLTSQHFTSVGVDATLLERVRVVGLEHTAHFYPMIVGKVTELDLDRARREIVDTALSATASDPTIGAFVFECTNLPPYAQDVRAATGLPVWDALSLIDWLRAGTCSRAAEPRQ